MSKYTEGSLMFRRRKLIKLFIDYMSDELIYLSNLSHTQRIRGFS